RPDLVFGEAAERLGDQLEVIGEVRRPGPVLHALVGERLEERRRAVRGNELHGADQRVRRDRPVCAARQRSARDVVQRVRDVRARQQRLDLAVLAVRTHDAGALDRGGGVREVVGDDLVLVEEGNGELPAVARPFGEGTRRGVDEGPGEIDRGGGGAQVV